MIKFHHDMIKKC